MAVEEVCRKAGISEADLLQLAQEVWRTDAVGDEAAEAARGGECQAEEENASSRSLSPISRSTRRCCRTSSAENMKPARKRQMVDHLRTGYAGQHSARLWCPSI